MALGTDFALCAGAQATFRETGMPRLVMWLIPCRALVQRDQRGRSEPIHGPGSCDANGVRTSGIDHAVEDGRAPETVGGGSGCGSEWDGLDLVGWHSRIPGGEEVAQRAVEGAGSGLQEPVGTRL